MIKNFFLNYIGIHLFLSIVSMFSTGILSILYNDYRLFIGMILSLFYFLILQWLEFIVLLSSFTDNVHKYKQPIITQSDENDFENTLDALIGDEEDKITFFDDSGKKINKKGDI